MGKDYVLKGNEIVEKTFVPQAEMPPVLAETLNRFGKQAPNRFDPYEALDVLQKFVCDFGANSSFQEEAEERAYALRAYITGMER